MSLIRAIWVVKPPKTPSRGTAAVKTPRTGSMNDRYLRMNDRYLEMNDRCTDLNDGCMDSNDRYRDMNNVSRDNRYLEIKCKYLETNRYLDTNQRHKQQKPQTQTTDIWSQTVMSETIEEA